MWNKVSRQKWRNLDTISRKKDEEVTMDGKNAAEEKKGMGREIHRRWFVTVTGCRVCMGKKEHLETAWPRPAFFKVRGPDSYRAQEASENPCLAQPRETRHALFRRLCACCSSAVFTYVVPMYIRRACARWRHYVRRGEARVPPRAPRTDTRHRAAAPWRPCNHTRYTPARSHTSCRCTVDANASIHRRLPVSDATF